MSDEELFGLAGLMQSATICFLILAPYGWLALGSHWIILFGFACDDGWSEIVLFDSGLDNDGFRFEQLRMN